MAILSIWSPKWCYRAWRKWIEVALLMKRIRTFSFGCSLKPPTYLYSRFIIVIMTLLWEDSADADEIEGWIGWLLSRSKTSTTSQNSHGKLYIRNLPKCELVEIFATRTQTFRPAEFITSNALESPKRFSIVWRRSDYSVNWMLIFSTHFAMRNWRQSDTTKTLSWLLPHLVFRSSDLRKTVKFDRNVFARFISYEKNVTTRNWKVSWTVFTGLCMGTLLRLGEITLEV